MYDYQTAVTHNLRVKEVSENFTLGDLLTHNGEYWNASLSSVVKKFYQFGVWNFNHI